MDNANKFLERIENARMWAYFHKDWLLAIRSGLRAALPAEYHLFIESEAVLISPTEGAAAVAWLPDVAIGRQERTGPQLKSQATTRGTAAIVEAEESCEIETHYSLMIRRAPENRVVAVLELLSPSNKGLGNRFDEEKHLRKRASLLDAGVQLMEVDALLKGHRNLPSLLQGKLVDFPRVAWTAFQEDGRRVFRGWGWADADELPSIRWSIDRDAEADVNFSMTFWEAVEFNRWGDLIESAERRGTGDRSRSD